MLHVMVVEDDSAIREMLRIFLSNKHYKVSVAVNAATARSMLEAQIPDLILLDWMLPDTDGISLLRQLREQASCREIPVLMLTAKGAESDMVTGLQTGADDYMSKPVSLVELHARIEALLRRSHGVKNHKLSMAGLELDIAQQSLLIDGRSYEVLGIEFKLLRFFMQNPNRVYTRGQIIDHVWRHEEGIADRSVDVSVMRLRKVLEKAGKGVMLQTIRGSGYRFSPESTHAN